jgi:hypothetical protein
MTASGHQLFNYVIDSRKKTFIFPESTQNLKAAKNAPVSWIQRLQGIVWGSHQREKAWVYRERPIYVSKHTASF